MKASVYYKETYFELKNVSRILILKRVNPDTNRYSKFIVFDEKELGVLCYPLNDIKELMMEE